MKTRKTFLLLFVTVFVIMISIFTFSVSVNAKPTHIMSLADDSTGSTCPEDKEEEARIEKEKLTAFQNEFVDYTGNGFVVKGTRAGDSYINFKRIITPVYKGAYKKNTNWIGASGWSSWELYNNRNNDYYTYKGDTIKEYDVQTMTGYSHYNDFTKKHVWLDEVNNSWPYRYNYSYGQVYRYRTKDMKWNSKAETTIEAAKIYYSLYEKDGTRIKYGIRVTSQETKSGHYYDVNTWYIPLCFNNDSEICNWLFDNSNGYSSSIIPETLDIAVGELLSKINIKYSLLFNLVSVLSATSDDQQKKANKNLGSLMYYYPNMYKDRNYILVVQTAPHNELKSFIIDDVDLNNGYVVSPLVDGKVCKLEYLENYDLFKYCVKSYS